jgi:hypothetical protein
VYHNHHNYNLCTVYMSVVLVYPKFMYVNSVVCFLML